MISFVTSRLPQRWMNVQSFRRISKFNERTENEFSLRPSQLHGVFNMAHVVNSRVCKVVELFEFTWKLEF